MRKPYQCKYNTLYLMNCQSLSRITNLFANRLRYKLQNTTPNLFGPSQSAFLRNKLSILDIKLQSPEGPELLQEIVVQKFGKKILFSTSLQKGGDFPLLILKNQGFEDDKQNLQYFQGQETLQLFKELFERNKLTIIDKQIYENLSYNFMSRLDNPFQHILQYLLARKRYSPILLADYPLHLLASDLILKKSIQQLQRYLQRINILSLLQNTLLLVQQSKLGCSKCTGNQFIRSRLDMMTFNLVDQMQIPDRTNFVVQKSLGVMQRKNIKEALFYLHPVQMKTYSEALKNLQKEEQVQVQKYIKQIDGLTQNISQDDFIKKTVMIDLMFNNIQRYQQVKDSRVLDYFNSMQDKYFNYQQDLGSQTIQALNEELTKCEALKIYFMHRNQRQEIKEMSSSSKQFYQEVLRPMLEQKSQKMKSNLKK